MSGVPLNKQHLSQIEKCETIGRLATGIAHDFNNVIGAIMGWAELGLGEVTSGSAAHRHYLRIHEQAARAADLTRQLLAYARRQTLAPRNIYLNDVITGTAELLRTFIGEQVELTLVLASDIAVTSADTVQIEQILMNLCVNARDAMPRGGQLSIETRNVVIDEEFRQRHYYAVPGPYVLLAVSDNGTGIDPATIERIFEPFFSTKEIGRGTGLGLATVYGIVKQHRGFITVDSVLGRGTTFRIYLPAAQGEVHKVEHVREELVRGGTETILVAEDHDGIREMTIEILNGAGYLAIPARDGDEAVNTFAQYREQVDLVLLDVFMPKLLGSEVYGRICVVRPDVPVLFTTGYSTEDPLPLAPLTERTSILQKPYSPRDLVQKTRQLLDRCQ